MKICVTATGGSLDAALDPRFGRCRYFVIVDPETMEFEALENPGVSETDGAGVLAAQNIANKGIDVLITGSVGPNALPVLSAAGIKVVTGTGASVLEAVEQYIKGGLQETAEPAEPSSAGKGRGGGRGKGRGMGRGRGRGLTEQPRKEELQAPFELAEPVYAGTARGGGRGGGGIGRR